MLISISDTLKAIQHGVRNLRVELEQPKIGMAAQRTCSVSFKLGALPLSTRCDSVIQVPLSRHRHRHRPASCQRQHDIVLI